MDKEKALIKQLNAKYPEQRIAALREIKMLIDTGKLTISAGEGYTNNHVHTKYSFSPYSPAQAVWAAYKSGLKTVGIIDHDAVNGAMEFVESGRILGIATTVGFEIRTDWSGTKLSGRIINNPDQKSCAYICAHGLPHTQIEKADSFLGVIRKARAKRNIAMVERLNEMMSIFNISIGYDTDVLPLSYAEFGGEVTERHLLFTLGLKMIENVGKGAKLIAFLSEKLKIPLDQKQRAYLGNIQNEFYEYDLLNILKSRFITGIYIDAGREEIVPVLKAVAFIKKIGAIPTYCYLGNVKASPTGDKREQKFEDEFLEDLFAECKIIGFDAVAFTPSRNTREQLSRVMALCDKYGFLQISGEDINQPRQSFLCKELKEKQFEHLKDAAWALIGHEKRATENLREGMFANGESVTSAKLMEKVKEYKYIGLMEYKEEEL